MNACHVLDCGLVIQHVLTVIFAGGILTGLVITVVNFFRTPARDLEGDDNDAIH
jgi:hypothetical protein